jgi:hypothetical protein
VIFLKYEIINKETKKAFPSDEEALVKYSISYPELKGKDRFSKVFNGFYALLSKRYEEFAKNKLHKEAQRYKALCSENFEPFGAVLKYVCSYEDENLISVVTDAFVFCGNGKQESKRMSQNWEKEKGRMLLFEDFFSSSEEKDILQGIKNEAKLRQETGLSTFCEGYEKKLKKGFSKNDFYLTPKGYAFFYPQGTLSENSSPDVFFLLGFSGSGNYDPYREN